MHFFRMGVFVSVLVSMTHAGPCEDLKQSLYVSFSELPQVVKAGDPARPFSVQVDGNTGLLGSWESANLAIYFRNSISGSHQFVFPLFLKHGIATELQKEFTFTVPRYSQGIYIGEPYLIARSATLGMCHGFLHKMGEAYFAIPTHPGADVHPPVLKGSRFDKSQAKIGETVRLTFTVSDPENSKICTGALFDAKACHPNANFHLSLLKEGGGGTLDFYQAKAHIEAEGDGYQMPFSAPAGTSPGWYRLHIVNLFDEAGNAAGSVAATEHQTRILIEGR